ncbi:two-component sensor histidine kinase [Solibacillus sp. R5-41]|uniref:sensor histidine kinase n=1 Tax=Solibacillus sp. R5-41 TaxID=2048654 RepID=UPI000C12996B|nr:HAMP domain-containing sensor histidine kinase [Solibacillus sp. R5-41]ATP41634.1 two-component sensor histidine kinase [Solibacillus sp. R5-41]
MNKISTKLATYFFLVVLIMDIFLMFYLHRNIINSKVDEELSTLLANGANHRDVLMEHYSDVTIKHIVLMERDANREVIITDQQGAILGKSDINVTHIEQLNPILTGLHTEEDKILVSNWRDSPYIVSAHPYKVNTGQSGYVIMFFSTAAINGMVEDLTMHFGIAGVTSFIVLFIVYAVLSNVITRPLIRMKEATEKLSEGDFHVRLTVNSKDELGELAGSIQKLANDLERLKSERNEFLASISHELSTPLTYLIGYSKVVSRGDLTEQERVQYLEIIVEESNRMKELVKNLLELARMDENSFTVKKAFFAACPFFEDIHKLVEPSFSLKNIKLRLHCEGEYQLFADALRLEQIVINLLDNALNYSDEQSEVILHVSQNEEKTIISVKDSGIGIPAKEIDFIFEKLYRVEKSRSRAFGGSGIGLSVVKELVEAHGGTIEVKSKHGEGSTFTITI